METDFRSLVFLFWSLFSDVDAQRECVCMFNTVTSQWLCHGSAGLWIVSQLLDKTWCLNEHCIFVNWYNQGLKHERHALLIWITYARLKQCNTCNTLVLYLAASTVLLNSDYVQSSLYLSHITVCSTLIRFVCVCIWSYVANISHG